MSSGKWVVTQTEPKVKKNRLKNASVADVARMLGVCEERLRRESDARNRLEVEAEQRHADLERITNERDASRKAYELLLEHSEAFQREAKACEERLRDDLKDQQSPIVAKIRDVLTRLGEDASGVHGLGSGTAALLRVLEARCLAAGE